MGSPEQPFTVRIDWLQFSAPIEHFETVLEILTETLDITTIDWAQEPHGGHGYHRAQSAELVTGGRATLFWTPGNRTRPARPECHVRLPGKVCATIAGEGRWIRMLQRLERLGATPSRLDFTGDDYGKVADPAQVRREHKREAAVTRTKAWQWHESGDQDDESGSTFYLGSPGSSRRLAVYDKAAESKGAIDAVRWELRCRNKAAGSIWHNLLGSSEQDWGNVFAETLVGFVDFREPESYGDGNKHRRTRCSWFERLVGNARSAQLPSEEPIGLEAVARFHTWVETCLPSALAAYVLLNKPGCLKKLVGHGKHRMTRKHRQMVEVGAARMRQQVGRKDL